MFVRETGRRGDEARGQAARGKSWPWRRCPAFGPERGRRRGCARDPRWNRGEWGRGGQLSQPGAGWHRSRGVSCGGAAAPWRLRDAAGTAGTAGTTTPEFPEPPCFCRAFQRFTNKELVRLEVGKAAKADEPRSQIHCAVSTECRRCRRRHRTVLGSNVAALRTLLRTWPATCATTRRRVCACTCGASTAEESMACFGRPAGRGRPCPCRAA